MLLELTMLLESLHSGFGVFQYLTLRAILGVLTALLISLMVGPLMIRRLSRYAIGQTVRDDGWQPMLAIANADESKPHVRFDIRWNRFVAKAGTARSVRAWERRSRHSLSWRRSSCRRWRSPSRASPERDVRRARTGSGRTVRVG